MRLKKRHLVIGAMVVGAMLEPVALYYTIYFGWLTAVPNTDVEFCQLMVKLHLAVALVVIAGEIAGTCWLMNQPNRAFDRTLQGRWARTHTDESRTP